MEEKEAAEEEEGQLAIDVFQDEENIYILAPIAGVKSSEINITITDEVLSIRGERLSGYDTSSDDYFVKECYWGPFSRSYVMPVPVDSDQSKATLKDGLLRIVIPRDEKSKTKSIQISDENPKINRRL